MGAERPDPNPEDTGAESSGAAVGFRLPRSVRIGNRDEIRALLKEGSRRSTRNFVFHFTRTTSGFPRVGWIVPKHRHTIVERNRLKRRIREIGRREMLPRLRDCGRASDVLIKARPGAYALSFEGILEEIRSTTEWLCSDASS